jgi:sugar-phosphatase
VRVVLFDVDGVLLDSYAGYREVWSRWCAARDVDIEVAWAATHGRRPVETVAEVAAHLDADAEYEFLKQLLASVGERFPAFAEAPDLLRALPPSRWGVVTSGERTTVLGRFRWAGIPEPKVWWTATMCRGASRRQRGTCWLLTCSRRNRTPVW